MMRSAIPSVAALHTMNDEMNRILKYLENSTSKEEELWQWIEKLPKFQGTGRTNKLRLMKSNHFQGVF